jgi:hypothetical protein
MRKKSEGPMKKLALMLFGVLLFNYTPCFAEPSSVVKYLMNDSVSLFDLGLFRLESYFDDFGEGQYYEKYNVTVFYDFEKNQILIDVLPFPIGELIKKSLSLNETKKICFDIFSDIRMTLGIDTNTGKGMYSYPKKNNKEENSGLFFHFQHWGFNKGDPPKNLAKELDNMTYITMRVPLKIKKEDDPQLLTCKAPLVSNEIFYSDPQ